MTEKYPDVCHLVLALLTRPIASHAPFPSSASPPTQSLVDMLNADSITSFTMDAEIVAVDKDTGAYRTFQDLSNRAKKDVKVEDIKVIVGVYAFDLMLLNDTVSPTLVCTLLSTHIEAIARFTILPSTTSPPYPLSSLLQSLRPNISAIRSRRIPRFNFLYRYTSGDASLLRNGSRAEM